MNHIIQSYLFSDVDNCESNENTNSSLEYIYFDPLGRFDELKRLTIKEQALSVEFKQDDLENNGMINKTIRTRWGPLASIDWNGSEPIY